jgi:hypothetical protein
MNSIGKRWASQAVGMRKMRKLYIFFGKLKGKYYFDHLGVD